MEQNKSKTIDALIRTYHKYGVLNKIGFWIGLVGLFAMMILICVDVIYRKIFGQSIIGLFAIVQNYLMPICVFSTIGYTFAGGIMPRMLLLTNKFKRPARRVFAQISLVLNMIIFGLMAWFTLLYTIRQAQNNATIMIGLANWIIWPIYALLVFGYLQGVVESIFTFIRNCMEDRDEADTFEDIVGIIDDNGMEEKKDEATAADKAE